MDKVYVVKARGSVEADVETLSYHASEYGAEAYAAHVVASFPDDKWRVNGSAYTNDAGGRMWIAVLRVKP